MTRLFLSVALAVLPLSFAHAAPPEAKSQPPELTAELEALKAQPESAQTFAAQARLHHYLAERARSRSDRRKHRKAGMKAAERALALDGGHPEALMWWTAHRGAEATALNPFAAIRIANEVERTMTKLLNLAPDHDHGAADRVLGRLYHLAPASLSVGSKEKARKHLEAAMARAPAFPGNQLFYAEFLLSEGDCPKARALAQAVADAHAESAARFPLDAEGWKTAASALLERTGACQ